MNWLKEIIVDILFLGLIILSLFIESDVLFWVLWGYTGILLLGKILALFMPMLQKQAAKTTTPNWVYHLIYFLSVLILSVAQEYYLAGTWLVIWIISSILAQKNKAK
ncbi:hypothetical protein [Balneola vulgaris]|uniref:hypothetical protein n=1 Tax=Balneola vulgaris TaxID=287535 RepID=UPI00036F2015|nr:hypothetical protein [Balneola vulgaris]